MTNKPCEAINSNLRFLNGWPRPKATIQLERLDATGVWRLMDRKHSQANADFLLSRGGYRIATDR